MAKWISKRCAPDKTGVSYWHSQCPDPQHCACECHKPPRVRKVKPEPTKVTPSPELPNERARRRLAIARKRLKIAERKLKLAQTIVKRWRRRIRFYDRPDYWDAKTAAYQWRKALKVEGATPKTEDK